VVSSKLNVLINSFRPALIIIFQRREIAVIAVDSDCSVFSNNSSSSIVDPILRVGQPLSHKLDEKNDEM
jgi:hypothetical protein